ncbi:DUF3300 domain-containing protein [Bradyrhizobium sp. ORS 86]|uniref:DUF3300 domain-containing protein n=1 Tax=Bradyrhizobium sp. ORS 86 TaxID=1685970 RepID=UPI00388D5E99
MSNRIAMTMRGFALCAAPLVLVSNLATAPARARDATAAAPVEAETQDQAVFSQAQIAQLVAPIALYPDSLLTQILMASTYPLEVVEAARWSRENPTIKGQALENAMRTQSWDPRVKALTAVPQTLQMMNDKLDWTQQLGDAFLAQQQDVLNAVQQLRAEAQAAGNLQSTPQQIVTVAPAPADGANSGVRPIVIEPVNPDVYYVPVYNPAQVYGGWDYPGYQPFYWSPPGFVASNIISFGAGIAVGAAIWGGYDWWHNNVIIDVNRYNLFNHASMNIGNNVWVHNPAHRGNVPYANAALTQRFGRNSDVAVRDALRSDLGHDDFLRDRSALEQRDVLGDRIDAARPEAFHRPEGDVARRIEPAMPDARESEIRRDAGEAFERHEAPPQRDFSRPRIEDGANLPRWRSIGEDRPRAGAFGDFRRPRL